MTPTILELKNVSLKINGSTILRDISLNGDQGNIYGIFGSNGSGKTSLFNVICGLHKLFTGEIKYYGLLPHRVDPILISKLGDGIARSFQVPTVVNELTVLDNLLLSHRFQGDGFLSLIYRRKSDILLEQHATEEIEIMLEKFKLKDKKNEYAGALSYGERRILSILATVLTNSKILLLDEPFANLNIYMIDSFKELFHYLKEKEKRLIMIIEHSPDYLMDLSDYYCHLHAHTLHQYRSNRITNEDFIQMFKSFHHTYD